MSLADAFRAAMRPEQAALPSGSPFDLVQLMNKKLPIEELRGPPSPEQTYRVSHVIKLCPREEVLKYIHQVSRVDKVDAKLRRTFDMGKSFHTLVQNEWFGKWGWLLGKWECLNCHDMYLDQLIPRICKKCFQDKFFYHELEPESKEHGITAHVDGILLNDGVKRIVELKTANSMAFNLVANIKRRPQDAHVKQIQMYMYLTGIHEGVILYFDKNESLIHQFDEKFRPDLVDSMLSQLQLARVGMRTKAVPTQKVCDTKSCARAKSCPVRDICFK